MLQVTSPTEIEPQPGAWLVAPRLHDAIAGAMLNAYSRSGEATAPVCMALQVARTSGWPVEWDWIDVTALRNRIANRIHDEVRGRDARAAYNAMMGIVPFVIAWLRAREAETF